MKIGPLFGQYIVIIAHQLSPTLTHSQFLGGNWSWQEHYEGECETRDVFNFVSPI